MSAPILSVSPAQLVLELESRLRADRPSALAFDADGTLWSGDVGEDVFRFAVTHGRLREAARAEIDAQARSRGFECATDVNATAKLLFDAYLAWRYPEREICELMTWCFAGYSLPEMVDLAREALAVTQHAHRLNEELRPILEFARKNQLRTIVISASPRATVEVAASAWGFEAQDIAASTPRVVSGVIAPEMADALPYGAGKCVAGRALLGTSHWLGAFGDNVFDLEMLLEAELGVAVRPKPALRARLAEIPGVRLLDANFQSA
jgi:phosphatidylglycerophosphatase C